jgi:hypothetical protein
VGGEVRQEGLGEVRFDAQWGVALLAESVLPVQHVSIDAYDEPPQGHIIMLGASCIT